LASYGSGLFVGIEGETLPSLLARFLSLLFLIALFLLKPELYALPRVFFLHLFTQALSLIELSAADRTHSAGIKLINIFKHQRKSLFGEKRLI
jgi:hypothetical protein